MIGQRARKQRIPRDKIDKANTGDHLRAIIRGKDEPVGKSAVRLPEPIHPHDPMCPGFRASWCQWAPGRMTE